MTTLEVILIAYLCISHILAMLIVLYIFDEQVYCEQCNENELKKREARRRNRGRK